MRPPGLRFQFACAFMAASALAVAVSALLTGRGLQRTFDDYLQARVEVASQSAVSIASEQYRLAGGRWSRQALDALSHDFALTGYDLRLTQRGKILLDTSRPAADHGSLSVLATSPVSGGAQEQVGKIEVLGRTGNGSFPGDAEFRQSFDHAHLIAALSAGGIAFVFGALAAGWLTRPLRRLSEAARRLSEGARNVPVATGGPREVRALGSALTELSQGLDRQETSRRHLAENLAHELRTPLMLIQGRIEAMQDGVAHLGATGMEALHTEVLRLSRLIDQIERLASNEADPPKLRRTPVALHDIAADMHRTLAGSFEIRGVTFELDAAAANGVGDSDAICQITTNLLSNAAKYAPPGSRVVLSTQAGPKNAVLRVVDDGPQIPVQDRERIFQRFVRGATTDGTRGAGLGLAIARELAVSMGGALDLVVVAEGNAFELRLPTLDRPTDRTVPSTHSLGNAWQRRNRSRLRPNGDPDRRQASPPVQPVDGE